MSVKKGAYPLWLVSGSCFCCLAMTSLSQAQPITSDDSLSTKVTTSDNRNFTITGGRQAQGNLFHSFDRFSVPNDGSASFENSSAVQNIITRVTGGSISNIDGLIQARGGANLFLINPSGIIFGPNASLQIGGSFVASTASSLLFEDGTLFAANNTQSSPLLTISAPIGLQFGETAKEIRNRSQTSGLIPVPGKSPEPFPIGLQVQPGKTLALVGGDVFIERGGGLTAPAGRIELGSVAGSSLVRLNPIAEGWSLEYDDVQNFQDLQIQTAFIDTDTIGENSRGVIHLRGRQIAITESAILTATSGEIPGKITLKASESVEVNDKTQIDLITEPDAAAGEIVIETKQLLVRNNSFVATITEAPGQGGNLTIYASDLVEIDGNGFRTQLSAQSIGAGDAGDVKVSTRKLILRDGGQITSSTFGKGDGGTVILNVAETIEISGREMNSSSLSKRSGVFARSSVDEGIEELGDAGNLSIETGELIIRDGGVVNVSAEGSGAAGNLEVDASSILLDRGQLTANTRVASGGNITLDADNILLLNGSLISTDARSTTGGNIFIDTDTLVAFNNSDITANAQQGTGGRVEINAEGIVGIQARDEQTPNSDITASSILGPEFSGVVEITSPDVDPSQELAQLPQEVVNVARLIDQNACLAREDSEFIVTGRGGLPSSPYNALDSDAIQVDWVALKPESEVERQEDNETEKRGDGEIPDAQSPTSNQIVEAQGWIVNDRGKVMLTARAPAVTPHSFWQKPVECSGG